jgi:uncharacterized protein (DUF1015 family)
VADVRPINALHYDLAVVGPLQDVASPPYDVVDTAHREELLARSPYNAIAIDLPRPFEESGPVDVGDADPYREAAEAIERWLAEGALVADERPTIWALSQEYTAPDGSSHTRHGILARVRVEDYGAGRIRPHERTHPGPLEDRLLLTRATRHNLSPIFSLSSEDAWPLVEPATRGEPWGEATDESGTVNRLWRVEDPAILEAVTERLAGAELLIADGHHRYETARAYRDEVGGEGDHNYTLMALTGLDDPGLTVFPTHRLLTCPAEDSERRERIEAGLERLFEATEVAPDDLDPAGEEGVGVFGFLDAQSGRALRLRLRGTDEVDRVLAGRSQPYRRLDSAILEALVLKGLAGMSDHDIDEKRGIGYAKSVADARSLLDAGAYHLAFLLRPVPVEQVRAVAESGENMPPKSTYFFPKVMSGLVFNPVG